MFSRFIIRFSPVFLSQFAGGKKIIDEFKQYLIENKKVSSTLSSYPFDVNSFIEFVETDGIAFNGKFTLQNYKDFIEMQIDKKFKINTINKRIVDYF